MRKGLCITARVKPAPEDPRPSRIPHHTASLTRTSTIWPLITNWVLTSCPHYPSPGLLLSSVTGLLFLLLPFWPIYIWAGDLPLLLKDVHRHYLSNKVKGKVLQDLCELILDTTSSAHFISTHTTPDHQYPARHHRAPLTTQTLHHPWPPQSIHLRGTITPCCAFFLKFFLPHTYSACTPHSLIPCLI